MGQQDIRRLLIEGAAAVVPLSQTFPLLRFYFSTPGCSTRRNRFYDTGWARERQRMPQSYLEWKKK